MNSIYYYTDINYIAPGRVASNGIFSCPPGDENLDKLFKDSRYDLVHIGNSVIEGNWTNTLPGYTRLIDQAEGSYRERVAGVVGKLGEDVVVLASRLWINASTNHKRMSSDMMHKLHYMRAYMSEDKVGYLLLGPVFHHMVDIEHDRFLVQLKVSNEEWTRLYSHLNQVVDAEYSLIHKTRNYLSPRTVLLHTTTGGDAYYQVIRQIINEYKKTPTGNDTIVIEGWCAFPLPDYDSATFRLFMAKWMLEHHAGIEKYMEDLNHYANGVVTYASDPNSDTA